MSFPDCNYQSLCPPLNRTRQQADKRQSRPGQEPLFPRQQLASLTLHDPRFALAPSSRGHREPICPKCSKPTGTRPGVKLNDVS
jgi:hypothetical protein